MKISKRLKRNLRPYVGRPKQGAPDVTEEILKILIAPVLRCAVESYARPALLGDRSENAAPTQADAREMLRFIFGVDHVTIDKMIALQEFEIAGELVLAPWRRVPGIRGLMVSPGTTLWVRRDRRQHKVDLEAQIGRGRWIWVEMDEELYGNELENRIAPYSKQAAAGFSGRRNSLQRARMRRIHILEEASRFPCS